MLLTTSGGSSFAVTVANEQATERFVADIAAALEPGDLITLSGDLGAGKTTFARAMIRLLSGDPKISVPSPTFTLMQIYELPRFPVVHADLYRLDAPGELQELGFDDLPEGAVVMMEWPDRAAGFLPPDRLDIAFTLAPQLGPEYRNVRVTGHGTFAARADRLAVIRRFLESSGYAEAVRKRIQGDASSRSYERLQLGDQRAILMNAPRRPDGPPVRDGKPYSAIARLAEDVRPFVAMADGLRAIGFSAPEIFAADLEHGFLLLEDFGHEAFVTASPPAPVGQRYAEAADLLAALHAMKVPASLPLRGEAAYAIPPYDRAAFLIEAELLLDWYVPHRGLPLDESGRGEFRALWTQALAPAIAGQQTWVLRDFHSPNLIWLAQRRGIARVGLLDFQDAVIGPTAYDVASLLQDARVDVPENLERELLARYVRRRVETDGAFDATAFSQLYATMAAQRATKILGIFARLDKRDGKPQYLRHMPRVWRYLQRALAHPALHHLARWYKSNVPAFDRL